MAKTEKPAGRRGPKQIEAEAKLMRKRAEAAGATGGVKPERGVFEDNIGQQGEARARYQFRTMADAWKAPQFIAQRIRGILPAKGLSLIYGDPGSLKSMFALHCAMGVSLGRSILPAEDGTGGVPVRPGRVLIIDADNGIARLEMRLQAIARGFGVERLQDVPTLCYGPMDYNGTPITIDTPAGLEALRYAIGDAEAEMVILDSYGGACGAADQSKPEMQRHLLNLRGVAEALGIVVWGIHHSNKTGGMMGTQHFLSTADVPIEVQRPDKLGDVVELAAKKVRDAEQPVRSATWWHEATPAVDEFGYEVSLLQRAGFRADPSAPAEKSGDLAERVALEVLREYPEGITQRALVASIHENISQRRKGHVGERQIQDLILPGMVRRKLLVFKDGPRRAKLYTLGPAAAEVKP